MSFSTPHDSQDYTVGLVCALPLELAAVKGVLDASYGKPKKQDPSDKNTYELGRIGEHNVVIACLPKGVYGTTSAATVATRMLSSFKSIRFGLMVGIGGGVPSDDHDIRLGDVVVSSPGKTAGGVIQYDFGKSTAGGGFERIGSLNKPPDVLLTAIADLEAEHEMTGTIIPQILKEMVAKYPKMKDGYSHQGPENDRLFRADYIHDSDASGGCESCDSDRAERRPARSDRDPVIHYGLIASGNQVVKDGVKREQLRKDLDVICFEMEAAGLMDNFPCLVIRGICDYADSHKNKGWQRYAAAVAAAYAKELLSIIPQEEVVSIRTALETTNQLVKEAFDRVDDTITRISVESSHKDIADWLLLKGYDSKYKNAIEKHIKGTGKWFIDDVEDWLKDPQSESVFWCRGIPGAGKTILTSVTIQHIQDQAKTHGFDGVAYVYFDQKDQDMQTTKIALASILGQLAYQIPGFWPPLEKLYRQCRNGKETPLLDALLDILISSPAKVFLVFDAVDEASPATQKEFLRYLYDLSSGPRRLFFSSRPNISASFIPRGVFCKKIEAQRADIEAFVRVKLKESSWIQDILSNESDEFKERIIQQLVSRANGMFLVVEFLVTLCEGSTCPDDISHHAETMPSDPNCVYDRTWTVIYAQSKERVTLASKVLSWVCLAKRNLSVQELREAVAIEVGSRELNRGRLSPDSLLIDVCKGLIILDEHDQIIRLAHATVQDFLTEKIDCKEQSLKITLSCLTYLSYDLFAGRERHKQRAIQESLRENNFLRYAVPYFLDHTREFREETTLVRPLMTFAHHNGLRRFFFQTCQKLGVFWGLTSYSDFEIDNPLSFITLTNNRGAANDIVRHISLDELNDMGEKGQFPLFLASKYGNEDIVSQLLDKGADVKDEGDDGSTALHYATGHEATMRVLIRKGADVDKPDHAGFTALSYAAKLGAEGIVKLLLSEGADAEFKDNDGQTPLSLAAKEGYEVVARHLLTNGADINSKDAVGRTPLTWAACNGHKAVAKVLVLERLGVELNVKDWYGRTPLSLAAENGHDKVVKFLLANGADPHVGDVGGRTPLWYAAGGTTVSKQESDTGSRAQTRVRIINLLLERGADIKANTGSGLAALHQAAKGGQAAVVKLLLEKGEYINLKDERYGRTPLMWAVSDKKGRKLVELLLEEGADVNLPDDKFGRTTLMWAVVERNVEAVELLVAIKGINLLPSDFWSQTPLSLAENYESVNPEDISANAEIVEKLLAAYQQRGQAVQRRDRDKNAGMRTTADSIRIRCEACQSPIRQPAIYYHCSICQYGKFDICDSCIGKHNSCLDSTHGLRRRKRTTTGSESLD
ncbi:hypothetical protein TWF225_006539 [Orbilia oligospora]|nr:hypothetical protein TWF225_006539 [Orbilia oligospora]KAF3265053.1 hypothetical protein TWF217_002702 [Orbilia oligospora]KAF3268074.1 hypothetical protein TWF128_008088 [Orbilia oligospora]KAF3290101.1 hypothetical protein TWF132_007297 [Orbilia oligospora]